MLEMDLETGKKNERRDDIREKEQKKMSDIYTREFIAIYTQRERNERKNKLRIHIPNSVRK